MLNAQRPVADQRALRAKLFIYSLISVKKERPQYSCNYDKRVKQLNAFYVCKTHKKAPRPNSTPALGAK
jgi:hypothetical protein